MPTNLCEFDLQGLFGVFANLLLYEEMSLYWMYFILAPAIQANRLIFKRYYIIWGIFTKNFYA